MTLDFVHDSPFSRLQPSPCRPKSLTPGPASLLCYKNALNVCFLPAASSRTPSLELTLSLAKTKLTITSVFPGGSVVKNLGSLGFPGGSVVKNLPSNAGDMSSIPG